MDIIRKLQEEFGITQSQAENTVRLLDEGNTVPFIARYRKEMTGSLDDQIIRQLSAIWRTGGHRCGQLLPSRAG